MTQKEFDAQMRAWNDEQSSACHPLLDAQRKINIERAELKAQKCDINARLEVLHKEWLHLEQDRKDICRSYHEKKHAFIAAHPKSETASEEALVE